VSKTETRREMHTLKQIERGRDRKRKAVKAFNLSYFMSASAGECYGFMAKDGIFAILDQRIQTAKYYGSTFPGAFLTLEINGNLKIGNKTFVAWQSHAFETDCLN
jgi:hypothetical protein